MNVFMKYIFNLLFLFLFFDTNGQFINHSTLPIQIETDITGWTDYHRTSGHLYINYYQTDLSRFGSGNFQSAIWNLNMHYDTLTNDSLLTYAIIDFDTIADIDSTFFYAYHEFGQPTLDSIWINFGHENNSGNPDTLIIDLMDSDTTGYPDIHAFWSDTIIFLSGQSPSNQWLNSTQLILTPGILLKRDTSFAIMIRYYGALQDTFGLVLGYGTDNGICGAFPLPKASKSHFYPNSYAFWNTYQLLIPTQSGGDLYYDCNGNLEFDTLLDGNSYIQNWNVGVLLSSPDIGVEELDYSTVIHVFPNPAQEYLILSSNGSQINWLNYSIYSISGSIVQSDVITGNEINISDLVPGLYILKLSKENQYAVKKFIISN